MRRATGCIRATRTTTSAEKRYLVAAAFRKASKFYPRRNHCETRIGARHHRFWGCFARARDLPGEACPPEIETIAPSAGSTDRFRAGRQDRLLRGKRRGHTQDQGSLHVVNNITAERTDP